VKNRCRRALLQRADVGMVFGVHGGECSVKTNVEEWNYGAKELLDPWKATEL
jgi:hypothetical protein